MSEQALRHSRLLRELAFFGIVGGAQYAVDLGTFFCLHMLSGMPIVSNLASRMLGATCGYYLNGRYTFGASGRRRQGRGGRFVAAWLLMTTVSTTLIKLLSLLPSVVDRPFLVYYGKAAIEFGLFFAGFLLCKLWVFAPHEDEQTDGSGASIGSTAKTGRATLFVLAHPDDEYFFSPRIRQAVLDGHDVYCAFTTDGGGYGVPAQTRVRQSTKALTFLGVPEQRLLFIGIAAGIADRSSHRRLGATYEALLRSVGSLTLDEVYVLAWEGGHADHDASHLVGVALAKAHGVKHVYECPAYNCYRTPSVLFRVMRWIPREGAVSICRFGFGEGLAHFLLLRCFRSEWKSFLGLAPESFVEYVLHRRHGRRSVDGIDYTNRPHSGPLLYEKRFKVSYDEFHAETAAFIAERLLSPTLQSLTSTCGQVPSVGDKMAGRGHPL